MLKIKAARDSIGAVSWLDSLMSGVITCGFKLEPDIDGLVEDGATALTPGNVSFNLGSVLPVTMKRIDGGISNTKADGSARIGHDFFSRLEIKT